MITMKLNVAIAIYTHRLVCELDELYRGVSDITGTIAFTHTLPGLTDEAKPFIHEAFPSIDGCDVAALQLALDLVDSKAGGTGTKEARMDAINAWLTNEAKRLNLPQEANVRTVAEDNAS